MKSMLNSILRAVWRGLEPVRRPFVRKLDEHVSRLVNQALSAELEGRLVPTLSAALETTARTVDRLDALIAQTRRASHESDASLNHLLDELLRLRRQVDLLQQLVQPMNDPPLAETDALDGLRFDERDEDTPVPADSADEHARAH